MGSHQPVGGATVLEGGLVEHVGSSANSEGCLAEPVGAEGHFVVGLDTGLCFLGLGKEPNFVDFYLDL